MKPKGLYLSINQIDDDLIESAMNIKSVQKSIPFRKYMTFAVCLYTLIAVFFLINGSAGTNININEVQGPVMKSVDVKTKTRYLSEIELEKYYKDFTLPTQLLANLSLNKPSTFTFQIDDYNKIYDDNSVFVYSSVNQKVEIKLSKVGLEYGDIFNDVINKKQSRIKDKVLMIGSYMDYRTEKEVIGTLRYVAEYEHQDIYISISGEGMNEKEFILILEEVIAQNTEKNGASNE